MDLATLKFVVETKELEDAATKVAELGTAVSKLNKPMQDLSSNTNKVSTATEKASKATENKAKADEKAVTATSKLDGLLDKLTNRYTDMAKGSTSAEAGVLQLARSLGATTESALKPYRDILENIRELSKSPFDSAIGSVRSITQEYDSLTYRSELAAKGIFLTTNQLKEYSKIASEIKGKLRGVGLDPTQGEGLTKFNSELKIQQDLYLGVANSVNTLKVAEKSRNDVLKAQIQAQNDTAKANEYLAKEMERVNRLNAEGEFITSATNNRLIRFEKELKASGASAAEAADKLNAYKSALLSAQKVAGNRQIDYLSRALGPQITDIGVGLATGQAPLTILLQQGGQLRDQFALAGVAGSEMGKMLVQASKAMVVSIKDIGLAVGQLVTGAIKGTGKAIVDGIVAPFKRLSEAREALRQLDEGMISNLRYARLMEVANGRLIQSFVSFGKVAATIGLVSLGMLTKGLFDVIKEQDSLTTQLVLTGASLGINTTLANQYSESLSNVGINGSTTLKTITAMAKEGGFLASEIKMVVTSANDLKFAGVAIEDVVKQYSKLKEKPVEALIEIAKNTGLVKPEIIALVSQLEQQGKTSEAAAIAMKAYADVTVTQKDRLKEELSGFAIFMKTLSTEIADFFDSTFRALWRKSDPSQVIQGQIKAIDDILNNRAGLYGVVVSQTGLGAESLKKQKDALVEQLMTLDQIKVTELSRNNDNIRAAKALGEWQKLSVTNIDKERKAELDIANIRKVGLEAKKSEAEIEKLIADYKEKNKPAAQPKPKTGLDYYQSTLLAITRLTNTSVVSQYELNKAQLKMLEVIDDPRFQKEPLKKQQEILQRLANASVILDEAEALEELRKQNIKVTEEYIKQQKVKDDLGISALDNSIALNKAVKEESDELLFQSTLLQKTDVERKKAIKTRQSELTLARELRDIEDLKELGFGVTKEGLRAQAEQRYLDRAKNLNTEVAIDAATKTLEEYNKIADGVTDSIVTALIEGGEAGGKKLRSILEAELRRPITVFVRAIVDSLTGGATGAAASAGGNFLSSMGGSLISSTLGSISVGGGSLAAAGSAFGTGFMTTLQGGSVAEAAGIYSAAGMQGVSTGLSAGASLANAVPQIAAALVIANALGLFRSTKQVGGGISGTLGGSVDQYGTMRKSGTLFNGPSYYRQNQGTFAGNDALQQTFQQLKTSTKMMADTLKLSSAGIEDFTKVIDISFDGLTDAQRQEKLASTFASINDELAALVLGAGATAEQLSTLYNNVMQQRYDLETQLLELQGKTLELRERERAKIYDANKGLFDQIKALEDQKAKTEAAAVAMEKLTSVTSTIVDEINRLRGVSTSQAGLESQFAILTAQIRSSDDINVKMNALAQLPEITKGLEQIAASSAVNATDIIFARARLAQSLQDTLGYFPSGTSLSTSSTSVSALSSGLTVSSGTSVSASSSNQELLAALVTEVQGLRAEVRADVSHNAKTAKILERVNQDGESLSITTLV